MNDHFEEKEDELMSCWQDSVPHGPDPVEMARSMAAMVAQFDRKIFWRNFREYAAGIVLLCVGGYGAWHGEIKGMIMVAGVGFVMAYLWWQHRHQQPLDPGTDAQAYRQAMLHRYDQQIRLLSSVKYWYLLPLYLPVVWQAVETWQHSRVAAVGLLVFVTAIFGFLAWLNETLAVRKLKQARAEVESMLERQDA